MRIARPLLMVIAGTLLATGCGEEEGGSDRPVLAVATIGHVADFTRAVGGGRLEVRRLLRSAADPHDYEPRPSDARAIAEADVVIRSGGELDEWLDGLVDDASGDAPVLSLGDVVEEKASDVDLEDDPHWWQDPRNVAIAIEAIRSGLAEVDPPGADSYTANARAYGERLRRLDARIAACVARVPAPRRKLVTTHESLGYFARRYALEVTGAVIPSRSSQAQPSAGEIEELARRIRRERVAAVFPESSLDSRLERSVAREAGVALGRPLLADVLAPAGSDGETYLEAMARNTETIVDALTGGRVACRP